MSLTFYPWPRSVGRSPDYALTINGTPVDLLCSEVGPFAIWDGAGPVAFEVTVLRPARKVRDATLRPLRHGVTPEIDGSVVRGTLRGPGNYVLEIGGYPELYLFYGEPLADEPHPDAPGVRYFGPGQVHEVGLLEAKPGETIWIAGGAVVFGAVHALAAHGARIRGRGVIDNSFFPRDGAEGTANPILVADSRDVVVEGVTCIRPQSWTVKTANADVTRLEGVRILGKLIASDGIDIVGSRDIVVRDCFVRSDDDCLAVKSVEYHQHGTRGKLEWCQDVANVVFEDCVLYSWGGGSAMEIGHEFRCESVRNITFRNIDVLGTHQYGSSFSIRHCDGALIEDVLYDGIRVEHHYLELIGFRIIKSRYSKSETRGRVRNVTLRNVDIVESPYNAGYTVSHIGGWDEEHGFENVVFENVTYGGRPVRSPDDLDLYVKHTRGLEFR